MATVAATPPAVLLLKTQDDKYAAPLGASGFHVVFSDVLVFNKENEEALLQALRSLDQYVGVILTSPRAAAAIVDVLSTATPDDKQALLSLLQQTPIYSVGKSTSRPLIQIGVGCIGDDSGSADVLSEYIEQHGDTHRPMLFLCGNKRMETLPNSFARRHQPLTELVVYATREVDEIEWLKTNTPAWVVFFSPSGVEAAQRMTSVPWPTIKKAAIGKSSAAALLKASQVTGDTTWQAQAVAAKPTPDELAAAITAAGPHEGNP
ncbi:Aste57867_19389 [Aphanomyces stellatus]|uniref:Uroporphyrinogen-III synthase n=1 Tax=Aphanomyces stellatus TaxID=120398 RepID=A0A485LE44_9STRA|nr:hypothetical protein As57867_019325 [Aphanomyces stellatus]VFT96103.1 Aste57867_19389 [Aphanomyces stellatus]